MDATTITAALLTLFSGIGIFLIACTMMSNSLEAVSSERLKLLFGKASKSKMLGVGIGTVATAAIQSSGATTVMTIGFVNAGIMSLVQAATIIYGANIGTTITAQIVALGMFGEGAISTTLIFSAFAGAGAFLMMFAKTDHLKNMGGIITGFGMLFVGLSMMSGSMDSFAQTDSIREFLAQIANPIVLVFFGALITAIIQSSSVMTSLAITMVFTGLINLDQGIFLTMGSNIGSCVVAMIAGFTSGTNARRTALIHLFFNICGVIVFLSLNEIIILASGGDISFGIIFESIFPGIPQTQLAMFHTFFNVCTVAIILPFTNRLVRLVEKILPEKKEPAADSGFHLYFLDEYMLKTPAIAVQQTKNEVLNMASIAMDNFLIALDTICTLDYSRAKEFAAREKELNFLNRAITEYIVKLSGLPLNDKDHVFISTVFHSVSDLERIGDYAENIIEYADNLKSENESFSPDAVDEINSIREKVRSLYDLVISSYSDGSLSHFEEIEAIEDEIDELAHAMERGHIDRLRKGVCSPCAGAQYLSLSANTERIADHLKNVAVSIKDYAE